MVFVVGFSLVQVQGQFRTTEDLALKESNHVYSLDRSLFHFGTPASLAARLDLQEYVKSVIEDEWALLAHSKRSPKTDALYKKLNADIRLLEGETGRQRAAEAQMLAFDDVFWFIAMVTLAIIPLIFLMKRPEKVSLVPA